VTALALLLAAASLAGTVERLQMPAPSLHQDRRDVRVYLPPSYSRPEAAARRYPVVYLLHGWPGSQADWFTRGHAPETVDAMIAAGTIPEVILVGPDGNGRGVLGRSLYLDAYDGRSAMADFIARDLVRWTDSTFRTRPEPAARAIIGLSDGGTGAFNAALRHPDVFGACGSLSGNFTVTREFGIGGVIGPQPGAARLLAAASPALYVADIVPVARRLRLYFDCGVDDESIADNRDFHARLERLGVPHTFREFPGTHTWGYWREHLRDALLVLTAGM
jgi:putative tributyrin esterase